MRVFVVTNTKISLEGAYAVGLSQDRIHWKGHQSAYHTTSGRVKVAKE